MILRSVVVMSVVAASARADTPTSYRCGDGKAVPGVGCTCPANKEPAQNAEGTALCAAKPHGRHERQPKPKSDDIPAPQAIDVFPQPYQHPTGDRTKLVNELAAAEKLFDATSESDRDHAHLAMRLAEAYYTLQVTERAAYPAAQDDAARQQAAKIVAASHERMLRYYGIVIAKHQDFAQLDEAYYAKGHELVEYVPLVAESDADRGARHAKALATWYELVQKLPKSKFVAWAYARYGDEFFASAVAGEQEWGFAREAYGATLRMKDAPPIALAYARYKRGFAAWHVKDYKAAVADFNAARAAVKSSEDPAAKAIDAAAAAAVAQFD
jgi:hypothetical protein